MMKSHKHERKQQQQQQQEQQQRLSITATSISTSTAKSQPESLSTFSTPPPPASAPSSARSSSARITRSARNLYSTLTSTPIQTDTADTATDTATVSAPASSPAPIDSSWLESTTPLRSSRKLRKALDTIDLVATDTADAAKAVRNHVTLPHTQIQSLPPSPSPSRSRSPSPCPSPHPKLEPQLELKLAPESSPLSLPLSSHPHPRRSSRISSVDQQLATEPLDGTGIELESHSTSSPSSSSLSPAAASASQQQIDKSLTSSRPRARVRSRTKLAEQEQTEVEVEVDTEVETEEIKMETEMETQEQEDATEAQRDETNELEQINWKVSIDVESLIQASTGKTAGSRKRSRTLYFQSLSLPPGLSTYLSSLYESIYQSRKQELIDSLDQSIQEAESRAVQRMTARQLIAFQSKTEEREAARKRKEQEADEKAHRIASKTVIEELKNKRKEGQIEAQEEEEEKNEEEEENEEKQHADQPRKRRRKSVATSQGMESEVPMEDNENEEAEEAEEKETGIETEVEKQSEWHGLSSPIRSKTVNSSGRSSSSHNKRSKDRNSSVRRRSKICWVDGEKAEWSDWYRFNSSTRDDRYRGYWARTMNSAQERAVELECQEIDKMGQKSKRTRIPRKEGDEEIDLVSVSIQVLFAPSDEDLVAVTIDSASSSLDLPSLSSSTSSSSCSFSSSNRKKKSNSVWKKHGFGTWEYASQVFEGEFRHNYFYDDQGMIADPTGTFVGRCRGLNEAGLGVFTYKNGDVFTGEVWKGNLQSGGKLEIKRANGKCAMSYIGEFCDNQPNGYGKMSMKDHTCQHKYYEGGFRLFQYDGEGRLEFDDGRVVVGTFSKDQCVWGKSVWVDEATNERVVYEGEFDTDEILPCTKNKLGVIKWFKADCPIDPDEPPFPLSKPSDFLFAASEIDLSSLSLSSSSSASSSSSSPSSSSSSSSTCPPYVIAIYHGAVSRRLMHGRGIRCWPNGDVYDGEFRDGICHGFASWRQSETGDGLGATHYIGQWDQDKEHGAGCLTTTLESLGEMDFKGTFRHGYVQGYGTVRYHSPPHALYYRGGFHTGAFSGSGVQWLPDSSCYVGGFRNSEYSGRGMLVEARERAVYRGRWKDDYRWGTGTVTIHERVNEERIEKMKKEEEKSKNSELMRSNTMIKVMNAAAPLLNLKSEEEGKRLFRVEDERCCTSFSLPLSFGASIEQYQVVWRRDQAIYRYVTSEMDDLLQEIGYESEKEKQSDTEMEQEIEAKTQTKQNRKESGKGKGKGKGKKVEDKEEREALQLLQEERNWLMREEMRRERRATKRKERASKALFSFFPSSSSCSSSYSSSLSSSSATLDDAEAEHMEMIEEEQKQEAEDRKQKRKRKTKDTNTRTSKRALTNLTPFSTDSKQNSISTSPPLLPHFRPTSSDSEMKQTAPLVAIVVPTEDERNEEALNGTISTSASTLSRKSLALSSTSSSVISSLQPPHSSPLSSSSPSPSPSPFTDLLPSTSIRTRRIFLSKAIRLCIARGICTFAVTGRLTCDTSLRHCIDCSASSSRPFQVCMSCSNCHRNHRLVEISDAKQLDYCDCWMSGGAGICRAMNGDQEDAVRAEINQVDEQDQSWVEERKVEREQQEREQQLDSRSEKDNEDEPEAEAGEEHEQEGGIDEKKRESDSELNLRWSQIHLQIQIQSNLPPPTESTNPPARKDNAFAFPPSVPANPRQPRTTNLFLHAPSSCSSSSSSSSSSFPFPSFKSKSTVSSSLVWVRNDEGKWKSVESESKSESKR